MTKRAITARPGIVIGEIVIRRIWTTLKRLLEAARQPGPARRADALRDFVRCARAWARLTAGGRLASPPDRVGARLRFADGTTSLVFRETAMRDATTREPALLVIQFRLGALGSGRVRHAAFRHECVLHTPLFAGFVGFRSKLWADDMRTGVWRGIYEWDDAGLARAYAERMVALLRPFSTPASARYHVVKGLSRAAYLSGDPLAAQDSPDSWWMLAAPLQVAHRETG